MDGWMDGWMDVLRFCLEQKTCAALDKATTWPFLAIHGSTALVNPCTSMWDIRVMQEQLPRVAIIFVLRLALIS
jgi:hypothetical protein